LWKPARRSRHAGRQEKQKVKMKGKEKAKEKVKEMEDASGFMGKERKMQQADSDHPLDQLRKYSIPRKGQKSDIELKEKGDKAAAEAHALIAGRIAGFLQ